MQKTNPSAPRRPAAANVNRTAQPANRASAQRPGASAQRTANIRKSSPARKAASPARNPGDSKILTLFILGAIAFVIACFLLQKYVFPNGMNVGAPAGTITEIDAANSVRITEVMSSNSSILQDDTGAYSDWIEITNVSSAPVNLRGWKLAKDASLMLKFFEFPNHTLAPGEKTVVFCTSTLQNSYGYAYHAPFKISAAGDTVILYNASDVAVQSLNVPELTANASYAEIDGHWVVTDEPTPLLDNTSENYRLLHDNRQIAESPIAITELMAKNVSFAPDENGEYLDWIEIHNSSDYTVSLNGYALSDSEDNLQKWRFPNVSIGPGEYLLVYCSGYDRRDPEGNLHTNFRLSTEKEGAILTNASGQIISMVEYDLLKADQSYSLQSDGTWTPYLSPTPGMSNSFTSAALIEHQFAAQNSTGVFINEVMASTNAANDGNASYDWVELYNSSYSPVNLSGWGLSDDPSKPRKWQFPEGAVIPAGSYIGIYLSGLNTQKSGYYHTNFKLSSTEGETLVLSDPEGNIYDRACLGRQYSNQSYGRISGKPGFYYLIGSTPGTANVTTGYETRMNVPKFSISGGLYEKGSLLQLTLSSEPGATIYYTLDCSTPDPAAVGGASFTPDPRLDGVSGQYRTYLYTGPILMNETTVVRAISVKDGQLSSMVGTETYLIGENHTLQVVSLVTNPADLWDYNRGIYVYGPNAYAESPYGRLNHGANFWMTWEKDANIEIYSTDGSTVLSQGCGLRLHGQYSRAEAQKPFKIFARSKYGSNVFKAKLFPNRDYTEYHSFLLRASGQDVAKTRMRDSILTSLAEGMSVMYQDTAVAVLYLNGQYWGQYNLREHVSPYSIFQWHNWDLSDKDSIDIIKANDTVLHGSNKSWEEFQAWYNKNGIDTPEKLEYARQYVDIENYLEYVAMEIYTGNTDPLNCKRYRYEGADGKWRWVLFDLDWAFTTDTNSPRRWLEPGGVVTWNKTDNTLYIELMKNPQCKEWFLKMFAEKLETVWSSESVIARINERYALLDPEVDRHLERWGLERSKYETEVKTFIKYAETRPGRLLYFYSNLLTRSEMEYYFGNLLGKVTLLDDNKKPVAW